MNETSERHVDLASQTYARIRELIVGGQLAPGSRIVETELAERLAVSRTPLRTALHRLRQEGWVSGAETGRQLRLRVSPTTGSDAAELYEILGAVEGLAARRAAALPDAQRTALAAELEALNERMRRAAADEDAAEVFRCHSAFHLRLVEAGGAPRLAALHAAIKPQSDRYRRLYGSALVPVAPEAAAEQAAAVAALRAGEVESAEGAVRANWREAGRRMAAIIAAQGERGSW